MYHGKNRKAISIVNKNARLAQYWEENYLANQKCRQNRSFHIAYGLLTAHKQIQATNVRFTAVEGELFHYAVVDLHHELLKSVRIRICAVITSLHGIFSIESWKVLRSKGLALGSWLSVETSFISEIQNSKFKFSHEPLIRGHLGLEGLWC